MTYVWRLCVCVCANDDEVKVLCVCVCGVTFVCAGRSALLLFVLLYVCVPSLKVCRGWLRRMSLVVRACGEDALIFNSEYAAQSNGRSCRDTKVEGDATVHC